MPSRTVGFGADAKAYFGTLDSSLVQETNTSLEHRMWPFRLRQNENCAKKFIRSLMGLLYIK